MKLILNILLGSILLTSTLYGQNNLITTNPDFILNTNGWTASGNVNFTQIASGALSPGSAKLEVISTAGSWGNAQIISDEYSIPDSLQNKLMFLTVYGKALSPQEFRVRFYTKDSLGATNFSNIAYDLDTNFQIHTLPIQLSEIDTSFGFNIQCGLDTGTYFFDDFSFSFSTVNFDSINQFAHWVPRNFSTPDSSILQLLNTGNPTNHVSIILNDTLAPVLPTQFGVNSNFRSGNSLPTRSHLYDEFGSFRFPAGSGSDIYFWDCNIPASFAIPINALCGTTSSQTKLSLSDFLTFKQNAQGEGTIVVNYGYARYGVTASGTRQDRVNQAASYAASFVRELNINSGANIKYWEIGNECYGSSEPGYNVNGSIVTGKEYGEDFRIFADSMKAVDPTIWVGAVLSHKHFDWNAQVLREVEDHADFLIIHNYFVNVASSEDSENAMQKISNHMQAIQKMAKENTNKPLGYFPVTMTEFNSQGDHTTTMANGLFVADALGNIIKNKYTLSTIWVNEWSLSGTGNNHSHGILAKNDPNQPDYSPRPSYTPYYYYSRYFGDQMVKSEVIGSKNVRAHASTFSSGEIGLVLLNYSDTIQDVAISYNGMSENDTIYWYSVHADDQVIGNKKFYVNNITGTTVGGGPDSLDKVQPFMAIMRDSVYLSLPKLSTNYFALSRSTPCVPSNGTDIKTACNSYEWIDGNTYTASNNTATYNILNGAMDGCDSLVTLDLTINTVSDLTTTVNGSTIFSNNSNASYQWLDCNNNQAIIMGATNQTYTALTLNGSYAVELTENGCIDTSTCKTVSTVGILENNFGDQLTVYPNPTSGKFSINLGRQFNSIITEMTDLNGKLIQSKEYSNSSFLNLEIEGPVGIYLLIIQSGENKAVIKLMKK